jgi:hypothetical protein
LKAAALINQVAAFAEGLPPWDKNVANDPMNFRFKPRFRTLQIKL